MKTMRLIIISKDSTRKIEDFKVSDWINHETFVDNVMCWYSNGTKFVVKDTSNGEIQVFAKVKNDSPTTSYTELVRLDDFSNANLEGIFDLLEMEE